MRNRQPRLLVVLILILSSVSNPAMAENTKYDPDRVGWSKLEFRASKFLIKGNSQIEITTVSSVGAGIDWQTPTQGAPLMPRGSDVIRIHLSSQLLGKISELDLWIDPVTGAAFQRTQLETGKKTRHNRHRSLRFTNTGVSSSTYRATDETVGEPYEQWTLTETFSLNLTRDAMLTEPSALFYLLAVTNLEKPGDQVTIHVFSKGQVMRVTLAVEERTEVGVDYLESSSSRHEDLRVKGRREVLRIRLDGRPLEEGDSGVDFEFLGLKGDVEVFLDPEGRFPVQISGDIKRAGRGHVRLQRVVLEYD